MQNRLKSGDFEVLYALPNHVLENDVYNEHIALVSSRNAHLQIKATQNPAVKALANGFKNERGQQREISFLIMSPDFATACPAAKEAVVSFRNSFALACLVHASAKKIGNPNMFEPLFSDYFDICSVAPTKNGHLYGLSAGRNSWDKLYGFTGNISHDLVAMGSFLKCRPDQQLWEYLMTAWNQKYVRQRQSWKTNKLFRSLAVAFNAAALPHKNCLWFHDFGVQVGLWVSAFEILAHPKKTNVNLLSVIQLLNTREFAEP